jgi:hypothetical protein
MRVRDARELAEGTRIKVTHVAADRAEQLGHVDDKRRLTGRTGTARQLHNPGSAIAQLTVDWDDNDAGTLMLASEDQFEVIEQPKPPATQPQG